MHVIRKEVTRSLSVHVGLDVTTCLVTIQQLVDKLLKSCGLKSQLNGNTFYNKFVNKIKNQMSFLW